MANKDDRRTQNLLLCQFLLASRSVGLLLVNITADSVLMLMHVCTTHIWSGARVTRGDGLFANARPDQLLAAANEASACRCLWRRSSRAALHYPQRLRT